MAFYSQTNRRFKGLEIKVGIFALISILALVALLAFVIQRSDIFSPSSSLFFFVKSGEGIKEGMPVKLSGFTIGSVHKQDLWDMSQVESHHSAGLSGLAVKVTLDIKTRYLEWIPMDSNAFLRKENVIGDQIIEIIPGASDTSVKAASFVKFEKEKTLNDYFELISEQVKKVQEEAANTMKYLNDPDGEVRKAFENIHSFTVGLVETREKIDKSFVALDNTLLTVNEQVLSMSQEAHLAIQDLNRALGTTNAALPGTFKKIEDSLESIANVTAELQGLTKTLSQDLPEIVETGIDVSQDADSVMESLKKTWPVSSNIEPSKSAPMEVDSYGGK